MRVLLLADSLGNGGLERQLALLATNLPPEWEARLFAMGGGLFEPYLRSQGVDLTVRRRRLRFDPIAPAGLWPILQAWRPDVVHAWSWISAMVAEPLCRVWGIPLVNGMIRSGALDRDHQRLKRLGLAGATLIVANTHAGLHAWGVGPRKGRVVHNGFDESRLADVNRGCEAPADRFTVVMTGRMVPEKDFAVVIAAARRLTRHSRGWRFVLVGDGPDRSVLQQEAQDLIEAGVLTFPDPRFDVLDAVSGADVGVLMTNPQLAYEGLSNSIMEYMALGIPVVCGDGGGNPELVVAGTGFIVEPGDADGLAARLVYLRNHEDERAAMGRAARVRILTDFSVSAMVERMLDVYAEALNLTRARRSGPRPPTSRGSAAARRAH
jgi:glycosyltransferase involved in cell wall biosynthesis